MGFFSWKTSDTNQSIVNRHAGGTRPVKMLDDTGRSWVENDYDGYGEFGGMDFYELVDIMNGGTGDRSLGIQLCDVNHFDPAPDNVKTPRLVEADCTTPWAELPPSKSCPNQGFFY